MKRMMLACTLLAAMGAQAQLEKGRWLMGAAVSAYRFRYHQKSSFNRGISLGSSFQVGRFVSRNMALGFAVSFLGQGSRSNDPLIDDGFHTNAWGAGLFVRCYYPLGKGFSFFLYPNASFDQSDYYELENGLITGRGRRRSASLRVSPGVSFQLGRRFQLETHLPSVLTFAYERERVRTLAGDPKGHETEIGARLGPGESARLNIGFNILLGK